MRQRVDRQHRRRPAVLGGLQEQQPDGPAAHDRDAGRGPQVSEVEGVDGHAERLQDGAVRGAEQRRQGVQQLSRPRHQLAQPAVDRAVPGEIYRWAQVAVATAAGRAGAARDGRVDRHRSTGQRAVADHTGDLVTGDHRPRELHVTDASLLEPVQI